MPKLREVKEEIDSSESSNWWQKSSGSDFGILVENPDLPQVYKSSSMSNTFRPTTTASTDFSPSEVHLKMHKCYWCNFESSSIASVTCHMSSKHNLVILIFRCSRCREKFVAEVEMEEHCRQCNIDSCFEQLNAADFSDVMGNSIPFSKFSKRKPSADKLLSSKSVVELDSSSNRPKIYSCSMCDFKTKYKNCLNRHRKCLHDFDDEGSLPAKVKCSQCGYYFRSMEALNRHIENKHSSVKTRKCSLCDFETRKLANLRDHRRSVHGVDDTGIPSVTVKCSDCDYSSSSIYALSRHMQRMHPGLEAVGWIYCSLCRRKFASADELEKHLVNHKACKCSRCDFETKCRLSMREHQRCIHGIDYAGNLISTFKCSGCDYSSTSVKLLRSHMNRMHSGVKLLQPVDPDNRCSICSKKFKTADFLEKHKAAHKTFSCTMCDYTAVFRYRMVAHTKSVHRFDSNGKGISKMKCSECDYSTFLPNRLERHKRLRHTALKDAEWTCLLCDRAFASEEELAEHKATLHTYKCSLCDYVTHHYSNFVEHRNRIHHVDAEGNSISEMKCSDCDYSTWIKYSFTRHRRHMHNDSASQRCEPVQPAIPVANKMGDELSSEISTFNNQGQAPLGVEMGMGQSTNEPWCSRPDVRDEVIFLDGGDPSVASDFSDWHPNSSGSVLDINSGISSNIPIEIPSAGAMLMVQRCYSCEFESTSTTELTFHQASKHDPSIAIFRCSRCRLKFVTEAEIEEHCRRCGVPAGSERSNYVDFAAAERNSKSKRRTNKPRGSKDPAKSSSLRCKFCRRVFDTKESLDEHTTQHSKYKCNMCDFVTWHRTGLYEHQKRKHLVNAKGSPISTMSCSMCDFSTFAVIYLRRHMRRKHPGSQAPAISLSHRCKLCRRGFATKESLDEHMTNHPKYKCNMCDFEMLHRTSLYDHRKQKHHVDANGNPISKMRCSECDFSTYAIIYLKRHVQRMHPGVQCEPVQMAIPDVNEMDTASSGEVPTFNDRGQSPRAAEMERAQSTNEPCIFRQDVTEEGADGDDRLVASDFSDCQPDSSGSVLDINSGTFSNVPMEISSAGGLSTVQACHSCDFDSISTAELAFHQASKHDPSIAIYRCSRCRLMFVTDAEMEEHCRRCGVDISSEKSNDVDFAAAERNSIPFSKISKSKRRINKLRHSKMSANKMSHTCNFCAIKFQTGESLAQHLINHPQYKCSMCDFESLYSANLRIHRQRMHHIDLNGNPISRLKCPGCDFSAFTKYCLRRHVQRRHPQLQSDKSRDEQTTDSVHPMYECSLCDYKSMFKNNVDSHRRREHHIDVRGNPTSKKFCSECDYSTWMNSCLMVHIRRMHPGFQPFKCSCCSFATTRKYELNRHFRKTHPDMRPYACNLCNFRGRLAAQLMDHMNTHTGERPHRCDLCDATFTHRGTLWCHRRSHSEVPIDERDRTSDQPTERPTPKRSRGRRRDEVQ